MPPCRCLSKVVASLSCAESGLGAGASSPARLRGAWTRTTTPLLWAVFKPLVRKSALVTSEPQTGQEQKQTRLPGAVLPGRVPRPGR